MGTVYYNNIADAVHAIQKTDALSETLSEGVENLCRMAGCGNRTNLRRVLNLAYEAGRKHDREEYYRILNDIDNGTYNLHMLEGW